MANEIVRNERKTRIGEVVSNKMDKTIVVLLKNKVMLILRVQRFIMTKEKFCLKMFYEIFFYLNIPL